MESILQSNRQQEEVEVERATHNSNSVIQEEEEEQMEEEPAKVNYLVGIFVDISTMYGCEKLLLPLCRLAQTVHNKEMY